MQMGSPNIMSELNPIFFEKKHRFSAPFGWIFQKNDVVQGPMVGVSFGLMNRINPKA